MRVPKIPPFAVAVTLCASLIAAAQVFAGDGMQRTETTAPKIETRHN